MPLIGRRKSWHQSEYESQSNVTSKGSGQFMESKEDIHWARKIAWRIAHEYCALDEDNNYFWNDFDSLQLWLELLEWWNLLWFSLRYHSWYYAITVLNSMSSYSSV